MFQSICNLCEPQTVPAKALSKQSLIGGWDDIPPFSIHRSRSNSFWQTDDETKELGCTSKSGFW